MRATVLAAFLSAGAFAAPVTGQEAAQAAPPAPPLASVPASAETAPVRGSLTSGDAADDPALWRAPDPADSLILGTDKDSGLYIYRLDGSTVRFLDVGRVNNIDVRYGFQAGERTVDIAVASDRTNIALAVFFIDPETGAVEPAPGGVLPLRFTDPYGLCLWKRQEDGALFAFVTEDDTGRLSQRRLTFEDGRMRAREVRAFSLGTITEGCAVDDRTGKLYIAEENRAVWVYDADPETGADREVFAAVDGRALVADAEGVAIWPEGETGGQLFVSSQGDNAYAVFDLESKRLLGRFEINGGDIDRTSETDGIEIHAQPLPGYPMGIFLAQDDMEDSGGQNFKIVDLRDVMAGLLEINARAGSESAQ